MNPDVLVIGAGLAGCSVAWHLSPKARVLVLEQGEQPGAEASSQNAGMVRRMGEDPWERALALRTFSFLEDPSPDFVSPSRRVGAVLGLVHHPEHLHDAVAWLRARSVGVQACDRPAEVAPALRGSALRAAWYLPDERVADPHALLTGFLKGCRRHHAEVRCRTMVRSLIVRDGRVLGVRTETGDLFAGSVVIAAGAWSGVLAAGAGLRRPLTPLRRTLLQSEIHPVSDPRHPWCWLDDVGVYVRPEAGGWLVSGCDETPDVPALGPGSGGSVDAIRRAQATDKIERFFPSLAPLTWRKGWTGLRTFAPDRRPLLGADPELHGLWWAAGLGGFGVTCSVAIGEAVSSWLAGEATPWLEPDGVSPNRRHLQRWPIRPNGDLAETRLIGSTAGSLDS